MNSMQLAFVLALAGLTVLFITVSDVHTLDLFGNLAQWAALLLGAISLTGGVNLLEHRSVSRQAWIRIAIGVWIWLGGQTGLFHNVKQPNPLERRASLPAVLADLRNAGGHGGPPLPHFLLKRD